MVRQAPPPTRPRGNSTGSASAPVATMSSVQMVPVRRNIPPIESDKGNKAKSNLHGAWAVVGGIYLVSLAFAV